MAPTATQTATALLAHLDAEHRDQVEQIIAAGRAAWATDPYSDALELVDTDGFPIARLWATPHPDLEIHPRRFFDALTCDDTDDAYTR